MMPEPTQSATAPLPIPKKKVVLNEHGATAKIRNPWLVALFSLITIGISYLFWYYFVNREWRTTVKLTRSTSATRQE